MDYLKPTTHINIYDYDHVVSIGNKCITTSILRELNVYKESFPFDYIPTTPWIILKYLKNPDDFFPKKNSVLNNDGVWFGHWNLDDKYEETIQSFQRRFQRLYEILQNKKRVLFVYTSEADIYNEFGNRYNDNYSELCNIREFIKNTYHNNFTILAIHINKTYENAENIINYTINVPSIYLSDDKSTHNDQTCNEHKRVLNLLMKEICQL